MKQVSFSSKHNKKKKKLSTIFFNIDYTVIDRFKLYIYLLSHTARKILQLRLESIKTNETVKSEIFLITIRHWIREKCY